MIIELNYFSHNFKTWIITLSLCIFPYKNTAYCFETISLKNYPRQVVSVPSKVDLTTLPHGKTFKVLHPKFTLEYFFNNRDIFGFIFKRELNFGIIAHLCFFRSCEENPYDINKVILMPQDSVYKNSFFSIKLPYGLQYDFQGLEFLPIN